MIKEHEHDLAFLDGGEGVYCMDIGCDFRLTGDNLLSVLKNVCRRTICPRCGSSNTTKVDFCLHCGLFESPPHG